MPHHKSAHWATRYIGCGFASGANGPDCYDCWGLVRGVYRYQFDIVVPPVRCDATSLRQVRATFGLSGLYQEWKKVAAPFDGDAVLMSQGRYTSHVGIFADIDGGRILHALPGTGVVAQKINRIEQAGYEIAGIYRHNQRQAQNTGRNLCDRAQSV